MRNRDTKYLLIILSVVAVLQLTDLHPHPFAVAASEDYYKTLNVPRTASEGEIRKAYRALAKKWHPDQHAGESEAKQKNAEKKFMQIAQAYETLSDPQKKRIYDQLGEEGLNPNYQQQQQQQQQYYSGNQGFGGFNGFNFNQGTESGNPNFQFRKQGFSENFQQHSRRSSSTFGEFGDFAGAFGGENGFFSNFANMFGGGGGDQEQGFNFGSSHQGRGPTGQRQKSRQEHPRRQSYKLHEAYGDYVDILEGDDVLNTLGKSHIDDRMYVVLLYTDSSALKQSSQGVAESFLTELQNTVKTSAKKYYNAISFAAIDCLMQSNEKYCNKFLRISAEEKSSLSSDVVAKIFSKETSNIGSGPYEINTLSDFNKVLKKALEMLPEIEVTSFSGLNVDVAISTLKSLTKQCLKQKDNKLGCVFVLTDKLKPGNKKTSTSWKFKAVAAQLKHKAELLFIYIEKAKYGTNKEILERFGVKVLPSIMVYRNTLLNRAEIQVESYEIHRLASSEYDNISPLLTKQIWQSKDKSDIHEYL